MKILLNCLPPADINNPSISLSILKKFMASQDVETEIKYWNFSLSVMAEYTDSEDTEIRLLPYLSIINDRHNNTKGNRRIVSLLQEIDPSYKADDPDYYADFLAEKKEEIFETIANQLEEIDFSDVLLFGISAKYSQWIPGMILAEEIKKIAPNVKIVVGGFGSADVARDAMRKCDHFDYVTWGEGEYPLLDLYKQLLTEEPDITLVPRMIYRQDNEIKQSPTTKSKYLDFDNYIYPDYEDYIETFPESEDNDNINFPINTIRSCHWGKCKFCDFNKGYKLRERTPECIVREIEEIYNNHEITTFTFVDSDTFGSLEHFEKLLDLIIDLRYRSEEDFLFWAEIIPNSWFDARLMQKMSIAGFKNIFIGYDALSDTLLKKMNKSNSFSDNIFFVKYSINNGISPFVNVIKHVPEETEEDVQECIDNLHFMRFFYNQKIVSFSHSYVNLVLSSMTKYFRAMTPEERKNYDYDLLAYLLPEELTSSEDRFHLFRFEKNVPLNIKEWNKLEKIEEHYKKSNFSYTIQENNGVCYYTEYCDETEIANLVLGEPHYWHLLKTIEHKVFSFEELLPEMQKKFNDTTEQKLKSILLNLKKAYIIYCNTDFTNIVSVIEVK